ncbi:MAG: glycosyltransferase [Porphyromonadaceae bacterium]|nr:glycosyltransferase [Porphyromonadaceae bacterium]
MKQNNPLISVAMPCYNNAPYVAEAIESMLNQTFTDFELIILDDCSSDNSAEVIKSFTDKRIVYHRNEQNTGLANNLNIGLQMARGKLIARMDGDDISLPERLQTQVDFLEAHPDIDLCSCGMEMFGKDNQVWIREPDPEDVKITMLFYSPILHASAMWRREAFDRYGLIYRQEAFPAEDYDLWARAVASGCRLANIPQVLYRYRIHGEQVTKTDDRAKLRNGQIQTEYLKKSLSSLSETDIKLFTQNYIKQDLTNSTNSTLKELKKLINNIITANKQDKFFQHNLLKKRLNKYYQSIVYKFVLSKKNKLAHISLILDLRLKQIVKLILSSSVLSKENNTQ